MAKINVFITLLSFSGSLATKGASLNNKHELNYDLFFIIILDKCNGSCNAFYYLLTKKCIPSETSTFICFMFQTLLQSTVLFIRCFSVFRLHSAYLFNVSANFANIQKSIFIRRNGLGTQVNFKRTCKNFIGKFRASSIT